MYIISMLSVNSIYAGYTTIDEYRLIFGDGGGFEAGTTLNKLTQQYIPMIQTLPYNEVGQTYRAKNINFVSPVIEGETFTSLLYEVTTMEYGDEELLCSNDGSTIGAPDTHYFFGCPRFLGERNDDSDDDTIITLNTTSNTVDVKVRPSDEDDEDKKFLIDHLLDTYWKNEAGITKFLSFDSTPKASLYKAEQTPDSAYLLIGDSAKDFIGIGPGQNDWEIDINKYKIIESLNNEAIIAKEPIHMGLGDKPIYIGNDSMTNLPIMTLFPVFSDVNSTKAKISINTNRVIRDLTVIGQFKVEGSLTSQGEFGVLYHVTDSSHDNITSSDPPYDIITECQLFDIDYVAHNFLMLGSVSGLNEKDEQDSRIGNVTIWLELLYKNDFGNYVKYKEEDIRTRTERVIEGSMSQDSVSTTTQLVINLEANNSKIPGNEEASTSIQSSWKACLKVLNVKTPGSWGNPDFQPKGDQNQLIILGLPGGSLDPAIPDPIPDPDFEVFAGSDLEFVSPDRPLFQKNAMIFRPEDSAGSSETMLAGIATAGDYIIFTNGEEPITLKAPVIDVDVKYEISVLKILDERTESLFNIPKEYTEDGNIKDIRLSFIIPYKNSADSTVKNYMHGPVGKFYNESTEKEEYTTETLVEYGIATYGTTKDISITGNSELRLSSGLAVGTNSAIKFVNTPSGNFDSMSTPASYAQLIMDDTQTSGYFLSNPTAEVAFTGVYQGDIGKMFYLKCAKEQTGEFDHNTASPENMFVKPSGSEPSTRGKCLGGSNTDVMTMYIHGKDLHQEGLDNLAYKFIVLSSLSTNINVKKQGTYLHFNLVSPTDTALLNGNPCSGADCKTETVLFSGNDPGGANTKFTFTNMAMIENIVGVSSTDLTYRLEIHVVKSHTEITADFNNTTYFYSGAIWALGFPKPL